MLVFRIALLCTAILTAAPGCGLLSSSRRTSSDLPPETNVSVAVESYNWNDITIYVMGGGLPQRLGMVTALSRATFDFSSHWLNSGTGVRLRALPVAGRPFTTETILVLPGQVITWKLENHLDASSFSVY